MTELRTHHSHGVTNTKRWWGHFEAIVSWFIKNFGYPLSKDHGCAWHNKGRSKVLKKIFEIIFYGEPRL